MGTPRRSRAGFEWSRNENFRNTTYIDDALDWSFSPGLSGLTGAELASGSFSNRRFNPGTTSDFGGLISTINGLPNRAAVLLALRRGRERHHHLGGARVAATFTSTAGNPNGMINYTRNLQTQDGPQDLRSDGLSLTRWTAAASCTTRQDPAQVAGIINRLLSNPALEAEVLAKQDAALGRMKAKDFDGLVLKFVNQALEAPRLPAPAVAADFWDQFALAEELEAIRQTRPAGVQGPAVRAGRGARVRSGPPQMIVNQWIPAAHRGDAVGDNARTLRQYFRDRGLASEIYALSIDDDLRDDVRPWSHPDARDGDATILHFAIASPMTAALGTLPGRRALCYHNITPPHYFAPFDPAIARLAWLGRQELETLVGRVDVAFGVSDTTGGTRRPRIR